MNCDGVYKRVTYRLQLHSSPSETTHVSVRNHAAHRLRAAWFVSLSCVIRGVVLCGFGRKRA